MVFLLKKEPSPRKRSTVITAHSTDLPQNGWCPDNNWYMIHPNAQRSELNTHSWTYNSHQAKYVTHYKTRHSSGDEIANVNFLYDDIVQVIQNTTDSCINSATARRGGYVLERMFTKFSEISQCNGHYAVQGHSRSPILVPIESSYTTSY